MAHKDYQIYATDSLIKRNRWGRILFFLVWIGTVLFVSTLFAGKVINDWLGLWELGFFIGLGIAVIVISSTLPRFIVQVGALRAFVTIDQLRTFFSSHSDTNADRKNDGDVNAYVVYGPGFHISYPWESRESNRNVPLEEVSENFAVNVQTPKGDLKVKGSVRLRPDITRVIPFLGGVAVIANDITDLIKSAIITQLASKTTIMEALSAVASLTENLTKQFGENVSEFEDRFGVSVGDVTISEMLPSPELQKTMSGITEAEIIANGAAIILGYENAAAAREAINAGKLTQADLNQARDRFMAASDNIKMNLDSNEYRIQVDGLDPELVKAISALAPLIVSKMSGNRKEKKNG